MSRGTVIGQCHKHTFKKKINSIATVLGSNLLTKYFVLHLNFVFWMGHPQEFS